MILNHLKLRVDSEDQSFMPTQVSVYARESSPDKNTLLKDVHIRESTKYNRAVTLLGQQKKYHCFILLKINNMMQGGQDCKLRAIEISASLPPLKTKAGFQIDYGSFKSTSLFSKHFLSTCSEFVNFLLIEMTL